MGKYRTVEHSQMSNERPMSFVVADNSVIYLTHVIGKMEMRIVSLIISVIVYDEIIGLIMRDHAWGSMIAPQCTCVYL